MRRTTLMAILASLGFLSAVGSLVRSSIGGRSLAFLDCEEPSVQGYVTDGLHFIAEGIASSDFIFFSGYQFVQFPTLSTENGWTLEVVADFTGVSRGNRILLGFDPSTTPAVSVNFGIGWWVSSNGQAINFRYCYHEPSTGIPPDGIRCIGYSIDGNLSDIRTYVEGLPRATYRYDSSIRPDEINAINGQPMNILSLRIYNRQLSDEEIEFNHAIDCERFGL